MDRVPGGLEDGARVLRRLRAQAQRALRLPAALRALPDRAGRLAAALAGRQPRPAGPARLRGLALLLQPRRDRGLGAAPVPGLALPPGAGAVDRVPRSRRGAAAGLASRLDAGRGAVPDGLPGRPQPRRLGRDRRRLRQRRRGRPHHPRGTDLRQLPRRRLPGRHLRPGQLHRLRSRRADLALVRKLGRPAGRPRRRRHLRHRHLPAPDLARPPHPPRTARPPPRCHPRLRLGRLPLHRLRPRGQLQRHPRGDASRRDPAAARQTHGPRRHGRASHLRQVRSSFSWFPCF